MNEDSSLFITPVQSSPYLGCLKVLSYYIVTTISKKVYLSTVRIVLPEVVAIIKPDQGQSKC